MMDSSNTLSGSPLTQAELNAQLLKAIPNGDPVTVSALIAAGADVNAVNRHGDTALTVAARHGCTNTVSVLIAAGANLNTADQDGNTSLMLAAIRGHITTVSALIVAKADVNAANQYGDTPLILAASNGHIDIVSVLIAAGANLNAANNLLNTALMFAALHGRTDIVSLLITAGANINLVNDLGLTALTFATRGNHDETAFRLLDAMPSAPPPSNRRAPNQPAIIAVEDAYNRASAEFSQGLTNILSALNEGTGQHALGTKNELLKIIAGYYAPDWCGRPSAEMRAALTKRKLEKLVTPSFTNRLQSTLTNLANTVTPAFRLTKETVAEPEPSKKARRD
jgi:ankyrin repeat protein